MAKAPRERAFSILLQAATDSSRSIDEILTAHFRDTALLDRDKGWIMEVVYGVTRYRLQLDIWIQGAYQGKLRKAQHAVKVLLRLGAYQLAYMHTPEHAAVNETVKLARRVRQPRSAGMVNAVLRRLTTLSLQEVLQGIKDPLARLAAETSHPVWLLKRWKARYDDDTLRRFCEYNNSVPEIWVRRNSLYISAADFESFLTREKLSFTVSPLLPEFYHLDSVGALLTTPEFKDGWFSFQNIAAGLVSTLVAPVPGDTILDACAAPGGKLSYLAELTQGQDRIMACDASPLRLEKVHQNIRRLKLKGIKVTVRDAARDQLPEANRILLDVPCSGTGVLNRRPDARWKRQAGDLTSLTDIQRRILKNCWSSLTPGGLLVYATCTLEPEENWGVIDSVLAEWKDAEIEAVNDANLKAFIDERGALATLPWQHDMDGMFAVKIRKKL